MLLHLLTYIDLTGLCPVVNPIKVSASVRRFKVRVGVENTLRSKCDQGCVRFAGYDLAEDVDAVVWKEGMAG